MIFDDAYSVDYNKQTLIALPGLDEAKPWRVRVCMRCEKGELCVLESSGCLNVHVRACSALPHKEHNTNKPHTQTTNKKLSFSQQKPNSHGYKHSYIGNIIFGYPYWHEKTQQNSGDEFVAIIMY